ncbi:MAG: Rrf2 family transcriptional regulator [Spirochaetaceae bacterium]|jgi:DNA-binding IscR family transcriptional regulator|nr:Rrf2 family transcriptional regulator [Spirochaetaceae bacterium]
MRISTRCSTAIHALLAIAVYAPHRKITGSVLAESIGANPVEVRKVLGNLKKAGIIDISRGSGGMVLKMKPEDITFFDVYSAVDTTALHELVGLHPNPSSACFIGKNIHALLSQPCEEIAQAIKQAMGTITLERLLNNLYEVDPSIKELVDTVPEIS